MSSTTNMNGRDGSVLAVPIYSDIPALLHSIDRATTTKVAEPDGKEADHQRAQLLS